MTHYENPLEELAGGARGRRGKVKAVHGKGNHCYDGEAEGGEHRRRRGVCEALGRETDPALAGRA